MDIKARLRKPMVPGFTHTMDAERAEAADVIEQLENVIESFEGVIRKLMTKNNSGDDL